MLYLCWTQPKTKKHTVFVLDVNTDCIKNFKDYYEPLELVDFLNRMINKFDVTFIRIINENPGVGEKSSGHFGIAPICKNKKQQTNFKIFNSFTG